MHSSRRPSSSRSSSSSSRSRSTALLQALSLRPQRQTVNPVTRRAAQGPQGMTSHQPQLQVGGVLVWGC